MAEVATTKKVTDLAENTDITDEDLFIAGSAGTASLRKVKWSNVWAKIMASILNKISANNLITTAAGYLLDARQGKALDDKISELNTKIASKTTKYAYEALSCNASVVREYTFNDLPPHVTSIPVIGGATKDAFGCYVIRDFSTTGKVRVYSPIDQDVVVYLIMLI